MDESMDAQYKGARKVTKKTYPLWGLPVLKNWSILAGCISIVHHETPTNIKK
jgi:hypothetical protein